jgi:hypothetical protein
VLSIGLVSENLGGGGHIGRNPFRLEHSGGERGSGRVWG